MIDPMITHHSFLSGFQGSGLCQAGVLSLSLHVEFSLEIPSVLPVGCDSYQ